MQEMYAQQDLSHEHQQIYNYLTRIKDQTAVPKVRFWTTNMLAVLGLPAGIPFYPAGPELAHGASHINSSEISSSHEQVSLGRKIYGQALGIGGSVMNSVLYHGFAKFVIDYLWTNLSNEPELRDLLPAKYSAKAKTLFALAFASCAILSTLDYLGMSEETESPLWVTLINVGENAIIHMAAFIKSASSDNFLFHKHFIQQLSFLARYPLARAFKSISKPEVYLITIKDEFILDDLYATIFGHFKKSLSANYDRKALELMLQEYISAEESSLLYTTSRAAIAVGMTIATDWSLGGYFADGYLASKKMWDNIFFKTLISSLGNLFFIYLVNTSVYDRSSGIVDTILLMHTLGIMACLLSDNWAQLYSKWWGTVQTFGFLLAAFSFAASVLLVYYNFPQIGLDKIILTTVVITALFSGFFNGVQNSSFGKTVAEMAAFSSKNEDQQPLLADQQEILEAQQAEAKLPNAQLKDRMVYDYNTKIALDQLSRLPKTAFLAWFLDMVSKKIPEAVWNNVIGNYSSGKLQNAGELTNFLHLNQTPASYANTSALYIGRTITSVKEDVPKLGLEIGQKLRFSRQAQ